MSLADSLKRLHDVAVAIGERDNDLVNKYIALMPEHTGKPECELCKLLDFLEMTIKAAESVQPERFPRAKIQ